MLFIKFLKMGKRFALLQLLFFSAISLKAGDASINGTPAPEQKVLLSDCVKSQIAFFSRKERDNQGSAKQDDNIIPLQRYLRIGHGDHFYTITNYNKSGHHNQTIDGYTYQYEGVAGLVHKFPRTETLALHRYFNKGLGDHFYTTSWSELGGGRSGWDYEGIECYVYDKPTDGTRPVYRYWNGRDHFYTINWSELKAGGAGGWKLESIQAYIFPPN